MEFNFSFYSYNYAGLSLRFQDAGYMLLVGKDLNSYEVLLGLFVC